MAREIAEHDPDGAADLMAQLRAEAAAAGLPPHPDDLEGATALAEGPPAYDPIRFRAALLLDYGGAITVTELGRMHFLTAFAYRREAVLRAREQERATDERLRHLRAEGATGGAGATDPDHVSPDLFPRPVAWEGAAATTAGFRDPLDDE